MSPAPSVRTPAPSLPPFERVVAEHGPTVLRVCRALLGAVDADDAWVETFVSAMRAYPDLDPGSNVRGWLVTIAHNRSIDQLRSARRRPRPVGTIDDAPATALAPHEPALDDDLHEALAALGPKQRSSVVYRYLADMGYADIARQLDISEAAARRNAADGIAALRARLTGRRP